MSDVAQPEQVHDVRWAVNVLLEKIADGFEKWETADVWRSDAAAYVRARKHALAAQPPAAPVETKSAPVFLPPRNNGERLPSSDAAGAGADTQCSAGNAGLRAALEDIVAAVPVNQGGTQGAIRKTAVAALEQFPLTEAQPQGCGTPGCADPGCDYGKGPLRCQSCGAVVVGEPHPVQVTDAMCEAAVRADQVDRIQGFTYRTHHVIRDVWLDGPQQKIWEIDKNDADAEDKFYRQTRIERMRKVLEAACSVTRPELGPSPASRAASAPSRPPRG